MERSKLKALLRELGISPGRNGEFKDSGHNVQICCPFHGETRPSCGIDVDEEVGKCFACDTTFSLPKLVAHCKGWELSFKDHSGKQHESYDYKRANEWLEEKYNVEKKEVYKEKLNLIRIDEDDEDVESAPKRHEVDRLQMAVFKCGKVTHDYFFERGFTKQTVKDFKIGWDEKKQRIIAPVLWEDGIPCGFIGRAVLEMKIDGEPNPEFFKVYRAGNDIKYHIYDNFPVGDILFPLPNFQLIDDTAILVEGQFDCIWMHQLEYRNTLASLGSKLVYDRKLKGSKQIDILHKLGVKKVVLMRDDDIAGDKGCEHDYKLLKNDFVVFKIKYPKGKTDPQELTKEEVDYMLENKKPYAVNNTKLRRIK